MQTTVLTHTHPAHSTPIPPALPSAARNSRVSSIDSLLKDIPAKRTAIEPEMAEGAGPGIFMGLRIALFFNAGLGIAGFVAYEIWTMMAR